MIFLWGLAACLVARPAAAQTYMAHPRIISLKTLTVFYHVTGPLSTLPMTRRDLPPGAVDLGEVGGRSCQREVNIPTSASLQATTITAAEGNGSYGKILAKIRKKHPDLAGIYDVKTDIHNFSVFFGVYTSACTQILARGYALPGSAPKPGAPASPAPAAKK
ncbi:MAG TPA: hypothetical protein VNK24_06390 [Elusimicrobiota bacterium]|nr:hypothetical protein [Elusimicrobiota bacterium]